MQMQVKKTKLKTDMATEVNAYINDLISKRGRENQQQERFVYIHIYICICIYVI